MTDESPQNDESAGSADDCAEEDLICRSLLLTWVVTEIDIAWHAGEIPAESAMLRIDNVVESFLASRDLHHVGFSISEFDYLTDLLAEVRHRRPDPTTQTPPMSPRTDRE